MLVETEDSLYEFFIKTLQIEVTGVCNLKCKHCRAYYDPTDHINLDLIKKLFCFIDHNEKVNVTISGGEPFLHPKIIDILKFVSSQNIGILVITTNGYHIKDRVIDEILDFNYKNIVFQISLDSCNEDTHNKFRGNKNSFKNSLESIKKLTNKGFFVSTRTTLIPDTIMEKERIIDLVTSYGAKRVSFGTVVPSGNAASCAKNIFVTSAHKKKHFDEFFRLKEKYVGIEIETEDPLKVIHEKSSWKNIDNDFINNVDCYIGGCDAGIGQLNIYSNGDITPCALFNKKILNLNEHSIEEARKIYCESDVIRSLILRDFSNSCKNCSLFKSCGGGCRAIPYGINGDYKGFDHTCYKSIIPLSVI
ncbi:hypothetical protein CEP48_05735 [Mergibacter septicus]|uniref:Uncharacterized protein n=1 Tax=Mergibacter septicus TaxID=221402 RepID=A0A8D4IXD9_9PAST|nr:radical SAM protein [Mergibacter septicus]AWX15703.1 hypothetical protein CEP47_05735 [Mergibacter septicus]QDJ14956.1 hypothetical protein CEP48_05735 [Mergibacter septicus]UTU47621.1 radical SAM protein [Mergibacter septicus]WMR96775.1 radical SAM protein [Mergibacter septicus]